MTEVLGTIILALIITTWIINKKLKEKEKTITMICKGIIKKTENDKKRISFLEQKQNLDNILNYQIFDIMENIGDNGWSDKKHIHKINHDGTRTLQDIYNNLRHYLSRTTFERTQSMLYGIMFDDDKFLEKIIQREGKNVPTLLVIMEAHILVNCKLSNLRDLFINGTENENWNNEQTIEEMRESKEYERLEKIYKSAIKEQKEDENLDNYSDEDIIYSGIRKIIEYT